MPNSQTTLRLGLLLLVLVVAAPVAGADAQASRPLRLRLEWGGGKPHVWNGVVEISEGRLHDLVSLGVEADEPGTIWVDGNAAWIRRTSPRAYDGFDVAIDAPETAMLTINLQAQAEQSTGRRIQFRLADVAQSSRVVDLRGSTGRLSIRRTPGDKLSVRLDRPHLVFEPGERFQASVRPHLMSRPAKAQTATFEWNLQSARGGEILDSGDLEFEWNTQTADRAVLPIDATLPNREGVYDLNLNLRRGRSRVSRSVQVVVISSEPRPSGPDVAKAPPEQPVDSFRPADAGLMRRVDRRRSLKLFSGPMKKLFDFRGDSADDPEPSGSQAAVSWRSYRLRIANPQRPHRLRLLFSDQNVRRVGFSLLEPNAAGQLMPLGIDGGIYHEHHEEAVAEAEPAEREYSILFWPRVADPILLIHDLGLGGAADIEQVEVFEIDRLTMPATRASDVRPRLVGAYMQKPLLAENFGATEAFDPASGRSLKDWITFQTAADRLTQYLRHSGFNSLMLAAFADGGAIYPSRLLQSTARYETGIYFSTGQDPIRKDVLELLFRVFAREGLTLVPELQFSTPLPELERRLAAEGDAARGIELVGTDGRSWRRTRGSIRGLAPYYNPLDARVQQAIIDVVGELTERYASHESFRDVAVQLSSTGYLQLPGMSWGYDDATVARFAKDAGLKIPAGPDEQKYRRRHEYLTGTARQEWSRWRCAQLADFHHRLAEVVAESKPGSRLILSSNRLLRGDNPDDDAYSAVRSGQKLNDLLLAKGLDLSLYEDVPHLSLLKPTLWRPSGIRQLELLDESLNGHPELHRHFSVADRGVLFYSDPVECRIPEFDSISPWQPAFTWLAAQCSPGSKQSSRRLAQALADYDTQYLFDGGWMVPFGQADAVRKVRETIGGLPAIEFTEQDAPQPLVVRFGRTDEHTYLYVVNEMSGPLQAFLRLSCPATTNGELLGRRGPVPLSGTAEASVLQVTLGPHEVWACRFEDPAVRILAVTPAPEQVVLDVLSQKIQSFQSRMSEARQSTQPTSTLLVNPGFEVAPSPQELAGWVVPDKDAGGWRLDSESPRSGAAALALSATQSGGAAVSTLVSIGNVRTLSFSAWLRSDSPTVKVRLEFEATVAGSRRVQFVDVVADTTWRRQQLQIADMPVGALENTRVRIRLLGPGTVWIDDVDIETQRVTPADLRQLRKVISATTLAWEDKRYADCERLLDSYWGQFLLDEWQPSRPTIDASRTAAEGSRSRRQ